MKHWLNWLIGIATAVIAIATVINLFVSISMWRTTSASVEVTRDIFKAAHRPYVGTSNIDGRKYDGKKLLLVRLWFKNFGSVPATGLERTWNVLINGNTQSITKIPDKSSVLFPNASSFFQATFEGEIYDSIVNGKVVLEIETNFRYKGVQQEQYYCREKRRYSHGIGGFVVLSGDCN